MFSKRRKSFFNYNLDEICNIKKNKENILKDKCNLKNLECLELNSFWISEFSSLQNEKLNNLKLNESRENVSKDKCNQSFGDNLGSKKERSLLKEIHTQNNSDDNENKRNIYPKESNDENLLQISNFINKKDDLSEMHNKVTINTNDFNNESEKKDHMVGHLMAEKLSYSESNPSKYSLNEGMKENTSTLKEFFKCSLCNFTTHTKSCLDDHFRCHVKDKIFTCSQCDYTTLRKYSFKIHLKSHFKVGSFKCSECKFTTMNKAFLDRHLQSHLKIKRLKCNQCSYVTSCESYFKSHAQNHTKPKFQKCSQCDYSTHSSKNLQRHQQIHSKLKSLYCTHCNYTTHVKSYLNRHMRKVHCEVPLLKCSRCKFVTKYISSLKHHEKKHSNLEEMKYSKCDYVSESEMPLHNMFYHSTVKSIKCSQCNYTTYKEDNLRAHALIHSQAKSFKCTKCTFETNTDDNLQKHFKKHLKGKFVKCQQCSFTTTVLDMWGHIASHVGSYKCLMCKYATFRNGDLVRHMETHFRC